MLVLVIRPFSALLFMLIRIIALVQYQALDEDKIDLSTMPGYKDLNNCVKCFIHDCWYGLAFESGCETNGHLLSARQDGWDHTCSEQQCAQPMQDLDDLTLAVAFYTDYCSPKGFTAMPVSPTILQPTGAFTETTTVTTTATVTAAVTTVTHEVRHKNASRPNTRLDQGPTTSIPSNPLPTYKTNPPTEGVRLL